MLAEKQSVKPTTEEIKAFFLLLPLLDRERREFQLEIAEKPESFVAKFLTSGFQWAHLYEVPFEQLLKVFLAIAGVDRLVAEASKEDAPYKALLDLPQEIGDMEWSGGTGGKFTYGDLLGYMHAVIGSLDCLLIYGCYLHDLIAEARQGDLQSLLKAIRIDPSVVTGPTASLFISVSVVEGDKPFLKSVGVAMSGKTGRQARYLKKFRLLMQLLHEVGELGRPTRELMELALSVGAYDRVPGAEKNVSELIRKAKKLKHKTISK
ncbi:MAG: hypothetical protein ABS45_16665 [Comamonas sp. SCN 65-56]|uniref:hypothetical protein n=1 Tax=Comamonas sp. SCN 65-56 TaxID=1660095 RepID=UPI0008690EB1|nr:hypothetical protein [Comamonas sp. SCN 65-56]ODS89581.1 MAG: hypothetical protein ABS45_16665 [Comamonas sp. SCN 65-56]